jgi:hypothetical protein
MGPLVINGRQSFIFIGTAMFLVSLEKGNDIESRTFLIFRSDKK